MADAIVPVFQLRAIELHELVLPKLAQGATPPAKFNFDLNIESSVDAAQKIVINRIKVNIKGDDANTVLGSLTCACVFSVANFEEVITLNGNAPADINEAFAETLNAISISTTRGVMFSELKGTFLHFAFLPIIDIKAMQKNAPATNL